MTVKESATVTYMYNELVVENLSSKIGRFRCIEFPLYRIFFCWKSIGNVISYKSHTNLFADHMRIQTNFSNKNSYMKNQNIFHRRIMIYLLINFIAKVGGFSSKSSIFFELSVLQINLFKLTQTIR